MTRNILPRFTGLSSFAASPQRPGHPDPRKRPTTRAEISRIFAAELGYVRAE